MNPLRRGPGLIVASTMAEGAVLLPARVAGLARQHTAAQIGTVASLALGLVGIEKVAVEVSSQLRQPPAGTVGMASDSRLRGAARSISTHDVATSTVIKAGVAGFGAVAFAVTAHRWADAAVRWATCARLLGSTRSISADHRTRSAVRRTCGACFGAIATGVAANRCTRSAVSGAVGAGLSILAEAVPAIVWTNAAVRRAGGTTLRGRTG